jgi:hypothetical protein
LLLIETAYKPNKRVIVLLFGNAIRFRRDVYFRQPAVETDVGTAPAAGGP